MDNTSIIGRRVSNNAGCRRNLRVALELVDPASVSSSVKADYDRLIR